MRTEEWRRVPGWPTYSVSSQGRVKREAQPAGRGTSTGPKKEKIRKVAFGKTPRYAHGHVGLWDKGRHESRFVHCLVLEAFVGHRPFPKAEGRHLDGNVRNNRPRNLAWGTRSENAADMVRHGRALMGSRNAKAALSAQQARMVYVSQGTQVRIGRRFGISGSAVGLIKRGQTYKRETAGLVLGKGGR